MNTKEIDSLLEEIEEIGEIIKDLKFEIPSEYEEEDREEEDEEYSESIDDLKEYQEKFRKYAENIKKELRNLYEPKETARSKDMYAERSREEEKIKTPWERGHKIGCGCPGCTKYREFYGINLDMPNQNSDLKFPDLRFASGKNKKMKKYEENEIRPCGGKLYNFFHGERAEFKRLLGNYSKKFNLNLAGY